MEGVKTIVDAGQILVLGTACERYGECQIGLEGNGGIAAATAASSTLSSCRQKRPAEHVLPAPKGGAVALADGHADDARGEAAGAPLEAAGVRGEVEGGGYCGHEGEAADEGVEVGGLLLGGCSCACSRGFILRACDCAAAAAAAACARACVGSGAAAAAPFARCCSTRRWQLQHVTTTTTTTTTILPVSLEVATATAAALVLVLVSLLSLSTLLLLSTSATANASTAVPTRARSCSALVEHHHLDVECCCSCCFQGIVRLVKVVQQILVLWRHG